MLFHPQAFKIEAHSRRLARILACLSFLHAFSFFLYFLFFFHLFIKKLLSEIIIIVKDNDSSYDRDGA